MKNLDERFKKQFRKDAVTYTTTESYRLWTSLCQLQNYVVTHDVNSAMNARKRITSEFGFNAFALTSASSILDHRTTAYMVYIEKKAQDVTAEDRFVEALAYAN